jgi:hypothetical protein
MNKSHQATNGLTKFYVHVTVHRNKFLYKKNQLDALISLIYFGMKLYMFRTGRLYIIRSLFTIHPAFVQNQNGTAVPPWSCSKAVYKPV